MVVERGVRFCTGVDERSWGLIVWGWGEVSLGFVYLKGEELKDCC